jgi:hypothetical protein
VHTGFWWGNMKEREHLEDEGLDERIIQKFIFSKYDDSRRIRLICIRI